jgi:hypothetical protein
VIKGHSTLDIWNHNLIRPLALCPAARAEGSSTSNFASPLVTDGDRSWPRSPSPSRTQHGPGLRPCPVADASGARARMTTDGDRPTRAGKGDRAWEEAVIRSRSCRLGREVLHADQSGHHRGRLAVRSTRLCLLQRARFNAERQATDQPGALAARPSWTTDPLRQIIDSIIASTLLSGAAVGSLLFFRWVISWLIPDLALPSPGAWISQGWAYVPDHWQWVVAAAAAELGIALTLARLLGRMQGKADYYTEELLLQRSDVVRSHAKVQLKSGTIYSGVVPGRPRHGSMLGEELILFAPIEVRTSSGTRTLRSESIALPRSEVTIQHPVSAAVSELTV